MDRSTRVDVTRTINNGAVIKMYFKDDNGRCNELPDITVSTSKNVKKLDVSIKPLPTDQKLDTRQSQELNIPADETSDDEMPQKKDLKNEDLDIHDQGNATSIKNDHSSVDNDDSSIKNDDDDNGKNDRLKHNDSLSTSSLPSLSYHTSSEHTSSEHTSSEDSSSKDRSSSSQHSSSEKQPVIIYDPITNMPVHVPTPIKAWEDSHYTPPNIPPPNKSLEDKNYSPQNVSTPEQQLNHIDNEHSYYPPTPRTSIQNAASPKLPSLKELFDGTLNTNNHKKIVDNKEIQQQNININQQEFNSESDVSDDQSDDPDNDDGNDKTNNDQIYHDQELSTLSPNDIDQQYYDHDKNDSSSLSEWSKFMES